MKKKDRAKEIFLARVDNFIGDFSQEVIDEFCDYWLTKVTFKNELMYRFQKHDKFDYRRRLKSWARQGQPGKSKAQLRGELAAKREQFRERVYAFNVQYPQEMLDDFFLYWSESNEEGTQMKWQAKDMFNLRMRLQTWARNEKKYGNNRKPFKALDPERDFTFEEYEREKLGGRKRN